MKLSYIITSYNRPQLLENAVACIVAEKVDESELILVDDCSEMPVTIPEIGRRAFPKAHTLIRNTNNLGVIGARNAGISAACGEYLLFLDDDDSSFPNRSRDLLDAIEWHATDFAAARALIRSSGDKRCVPTAQQTLLTPLLLLLNPPHINSVIWRRDFLLETAGMDNRVPYFGEHVTLMLGLMRGKTGFLSEKTVATFGYLEDGLTEKSHREDRLNHDLRAYFHLLAEASVEPGLTEIFFRIIKMLETEKTPTYDLFLEKMKKLPGIGD